MLSPNFFGKDLVFWIGIVEKRTDDDHYVGRCKVRIFGWHTADKAELPTDDLPWSYLSQPVSGSFWSTPAEGETVFGLFLDGENAQSPLILAKIPAASMNKVKHPEGQGFTDARNDAALSISPRQALQSYTYDLSGTGVHTSEYSKAFSYPAYPGPSTPFLALGKQWEVIIPNQIKPSVKAQQANMTRNITSRGETWHEPQSAYNALYPHNHVYQSDSLHVMEFDDSPGVERVNLRHRLGSGTEMYPNGDTVQKSVRDHYELVLADRKTSVFNDDDITVNGDATHYTKGDRYDHVDGNYTLSVDGDFRILVRGQHIGNFKSDFGYQVSGDTTLRSDGTLWLKGAKIHFNSASTPKVSDLKDFDLPEVPSDSVTVENQARLIEETGSEVAPTDDKEERAPATQGQTTANNVIPTPTIACPILPQETANFSNGDSRYRIQISKYFQLADFTIRPIYPHHLQSQLGYTQAQLMCNMAFLAQNIVDPIYQKYPGLQINSGFRKQQNGTSQHEKGEACDLQWPSIRAGSLSKYLEIANWIRYNLPFDQLILEHGNTIWLHVSMKRNGTNRKQVLTMVNGSYYAGLDLRGRS